MVPFLFIGIFHWPGLLLIVAISLILQIIAVIDIVRSKFEGNMQLIWVIIAVLFSVLGSVLYFIIGRNQKIKAI